MGVDMVPEHVVLDPILGLFGPILALFSLFLTINYQN